MDKSMTPGSTPGHRFSFADTPPPSHQSIMNHPVMDADIIHDTPESMDLYCKDKNTMVVNPNTMGNIVFQAADRELMRITKDGRFVVDGQNVTTNAIDVFEHFVEWLDSVRS
jgi:hypothetical protein